MNTLIQLIGPQSSGKTTLRKVMCPQAIDITHCFKSLFNQEMERSKFYYFYEYDIKILKKWLESEFITIESTIQPPSRVYGPFTFVYEGNEQIELPSLIFNLPSLRMRVI